MGAKREILPLKLGMENCGRGARGSAGLASWCGSVITAEAWMLAALASAAIAARGIEGSSRRGGDGLRTRLKGDRSTGHATLQHLNRAQTNTRS